MDGDNWEIFLPYGSIVMKNTIVDGAGLPPKHKSDKPPAALDFDLWHSKHYHQEFDNVLIRNSVGWGISCTLKRAPTGELLRLIRKKKIRFENNKLGNVSPDCIGL